MADELTIEISWKFFSPSFWLQLINQITILYMSQWLRCHCMCKIMSWFDDNLPLRSSKYFDKIWLWTHKLLVKWVLKIRCLWSLTTPVLHLGFGNEGCQPPPSTVFFFFWGGGVGVEWGWGGVEWGCWVILNLIQIVRFSRGACCPFPSWEGAAQSKRGQITPFPPPRCSTEK